jgi:hypothetical protein
LIADASILLNFEGFYRITPEKPHELSQTMSVFKVPARKGRPITEEGANQVYWILREPVKAGYLSPFLSTILASCQIFGLCNLIPEGPRLRGYGALTDSLIGRIKPRSFADTWCGVPLRSFQPLRSFRLMARLVLGIWSAGSAARHSAAGRMALRPRLSRTLRSSGSRGLRLNLPPAPKNLADLIGASRPQVRLQLAKLSGCKALIRDGRRPILVKPRLEQEALRAVA